MSRRRVLLGPTAVGKTAAVLALADAYPIRVLSLDSMQVFRGMDVGTAKPTPAERARCPHELVDLVDPWESYSVARWLAAAEACEARVAAAGLVPLYVGGTGLYLKALLHGLFEGPAADPDVRARLEERARCAGCAALHAELARVDPPAAQRIHPNDLRRIVRALEVFATTGRPISAWQRQWRGERGSEGILVGLRRSRETLRARVRERVRAMLAAGWVDEVRAILARGGFSKTSSAALGYAQIARWLERGGEERSLEEEIVQATHRFLRRQETWFRSFPDVRWIDLDDAPPGDPTGALARALELG